MKEITRQKKKAVTNTKEMQERIFSEMKNTIKEIFISKDMFFSLVQIINYYESTVETQTALKFMHWFQNEMNTYLMEFKSSNIKDDFQKIEEHAGLVANDPVVSINDSACVVEFIHNTNDLIVELARNVNSESVIRTEFDRILNLLSAY